MYVSGYFFLDAKQSRTGDGSGIVAVSERLLLLLKSGV